MKTVHRNSQHARLRRFAGTLLLASIVPFGCGDGKKSPAGGAPGAATGSVESGANAPASASTTTSTTIGLVGDSRTKWINNIPYDVWFDRPLEVYQDNTPLTAAANAGSAVTNPDTPPVEPAAGPPGTEPAAAGANSAGHATAAVNWDELIPADALIAEVKDLRVRLSANLQTVATFNRAINDAAADPIANDAMILGTLSGVVERTTQPVNWRDKAKYVRDLACQMSTVEGTGRESYQKAKEPFDKIVTMLDGGPPPDMESADKPPFADYASRGEMMKRIKVSLDWFKSEVNTESRLKEYQDQVVRSATILVVLGAVFGDEGYEYSEEPAFRAFLVEFVGSNSDIVKAATNQNFAEFESARGRLQNSCAACHNKYKDTGS